MRNTVDKNKVTGMQVTKITNKRGQTMGYNVEDTKASPGSKNFAIHMYSTLGEAREAAGIVHAGKSKRTAPKSEYPEQQTGYKRPAGKRR